MRMKTLVLLTRIEKSQCVYVWERVSVCVRERECV